MNNKTIVLLMVCLLLHQYYVQAQQPTVLVTPPMQGHTTSTEIYAQMLVQHTNDSRIEITLHQPNTNKLLQTQKPIFVGDTLVNGHQCLHFHFNELTPSQIYRYQVIFNDSVVHIGQWKTLAAYKLTQPENVSFTFVSCNFIPETTKDKILPGVNRINYNKVAKAEADFNLWIGDNHYFRDGDWRSEQAMYQRYIQTRTHKPTVKVLLSKPQYAIWDDHDYGSNNANRYFANKEIALDLFKQFWVNPTYGTSNTPGVFFNFDYQDAAFFLLDDRYHKASVNDTCQEAGLIGADQMAWLKQQLKNSNATFKFLISGVQFLNQTEMKKHETEGFKEFPDELEELLNFLDQENIKGVILLSGDKHHAELFRLKRPDTYDLWEVTSSPISSFTIGIPFRVSSRNNPRAVRRTKYWRANFAHVNISGRMGNRVCTIAIKNKHNRIVWQQSWTQQALGY